MVDAAVLLKALPPNALVFADGYADVAKADAGGPKGLALLPPCVSNAEPNADVVGRNVGCIDAAKTS